MYTLSIWSVEGDRVERIRMGGYGVESAGVKRIRIVGILGLR